MYRLAALELTYVVGTDRENVLMICVPAKFCTQPPCALPAQALLLLWVAASYIEVRQHLSLPIHPQTARSTLT